MKLIRYAGSVWRYSKYPEGVIKKNLERIIDQLLAMLDRYSEVLVIRFDLQLKINPKSNQFLSEFLARLVRELKIHYECDVGYVWAREQTVTAEFPHYHVAVMLNESKANNSRYTIKAATKIWKSLGGHHVTFPEGNAYFVAGRSDQESQVAAVHRIGYLAKKDTKAPKSAVMRRYGASQLARKL
ncbi:YagK/YfjJ domain-containing protein [Vibrio agarivorans]|uniref:YagK/YfjJ domain-containing protein n=1 Tax=Vibrio agarivorans TaxID=153622 RepID=UPI0025B4340E|nr:inovirus-type Gp2 protein [Vibrio agarivorans]MDN3661860.1 inovirus-type Gp2 protein [Vibrio agarivorans]